MTKYPIPQHQNSNRHHLIEVIKAYKANETNRTYKSGKPIKLIKPIILKKPIN